MKMEYSSVQVNEEDALSTCPGRTCLYSSVLPDLPCNFQFSVTLSEYYFISPFKLGQRCNIIDRTVEPYRVVILMLCGKLWIVELRFGNTKFDLMITQ
jgi:hypothetical protein